MIRSAYDPGIMLAPVMIGTAAVIYLVFRSKLTKPVKTILIISLACLAPLVLVGIDLAHCSNARQTVAVAQPDIPTIPSPPGLPFDGSDDESDSEDETSTSIIRVQTDDDGRPSQSVRIESARSRSGGGGTVTAIAESHSESVESRRDARSEGIRSRRSALGYAETIGVFSLLLLLAYLFLDADRRQRYIWPRRLVIAAAFAAVCMSFWRMGLQM